MPGRVLRTAVFVVPLLAAPPTQASRASAEPQLWLATSAEARVFILGFGEARDTSWFSPSIRKAFEQSSSLWLETVGGGAPSSASPADRQAADERMRRLSRESGRTFFDVLEPPVRQRTLSYVADLGINRDSIAMLRPWRAYSSIVSAFFSRRKAEYAPVGVDAVLRDMARGAGKTVGYEFPTGEAFATFMAAMPDKAQSQYIEWLLDFLDDYKQGLNDATESFSWVTGNPGSGPTRSLDRMRVKMPELYQVMQPQRNIWWARKAHELLTTKGTHFIAIGQLHVLGPDGVPRQLERLGIRVERQP